MNLINFVPPQLLSPLDSFEIKIKNKLVDIESLIMNAQVHKISTLITNKLVDIHKPLPSGNLPLHLAVREMNLEIVQLLLRSGAQCEIKDSQGLNALEYAVLSKNDRIFSELIAHRLGIDVKDIKLQVESKATLVRVSTLRKSLRKFLRIDIHKIPISCQLAYQGQTGYLLKFQTDSQFKNLMTQPDVLGLTPLQYAVLGGHIDFLKILISSGISIDSVSKEGNTLMHYAVLGGNRRMIKYLIDQKVDLNQSNKNGETPLHYAAALNRLTLIKLLLKNGGDLRKVDQYRLTPLQILGVSAFLKNPLTLGKIDALMLLLNISFWLSRYFLNENLFYYKGILAESSDALFSFYKSNTLTAKGLTCLIEAAAQWMKTPLTFQINQAWKTSLVTKSTWEGLSSAKHNFKYDKLCATRNLIVHGLNLMFSGYTFFKTFMDGSHPYRVVSNERLTPHN